MPPKRWEFLIAYVEILKLHVILEMEDIPVPAVIMYRSSKPQAVLTKQSILEIIKLSIHNSSEKLHACPQRRPITTLHMSLLHRRKRLASELTVPSLPLPLYLPSTMTIPSSLQSSFPTEQPLQRPFALQCLFTTPKRSPLSTMLPPVTAL